MEGAWSGILCDTSVRATLTPMRKGCLWIDCPCAFCFRFHYCIKEFGCDDHAQDDSPPNDPACIPAAAEEGEEASPPQHDDDPDWDQAVSGVLSAVI